MFRTRFPESIAAVSTFHTLALCVLWFQFILWELNSSTLLSHFKYIWRVFLLIMLWLFIIKLCKKVMI